MLAAPIPLDTNGCGGGSNDINATGVIVGNSCGVPAAWKPSGGGYTRVLLGDLGNHHPGPETARGVNNGTVAPLIAAGDVGQGVFWTRF